jgi:DNA replication and repair protein RecF
MYLTHLSLTDFRIFSRFDQDVPQNALILIGDNAQGKTSLLEAVYYLSALDSFQASSTAELINFSALKNNLAVCRIVADYRKDDKNHHLEIRIIRDTISNGNASIRKEVILDGSQTKVNSVIGHFNAVLFLPHMLQIATGSPQRRRHYLNLTISQVDPRYNETRINYPIGMKESPRQDPILCTPGFRRYGISDIYLPQSIRNSPGGKKSCV